MEDTIVGSLAKFWVVCALLAETYVSPWTLSANHTDSFSIFSIFIHLEVFCVKSRQTCPNCTAPIFFVAVSNKSNIRIWFSKTSAVLSVWQLFVIIIYFSMTNRIPIINNNGSPGKNAYVCNKNILLLFWTNCFNLGTLFKLILGFRILIWPQLWSSLFS